MIAAREMLFRDVVHFLKLWFPIVIAFTTVLTATWPNGRDDYNDPWKSFWRVLEALIYMTLSGELTEKLNGQVYASSLLEAAASNDINWRFRVILFLGFELSFGVVSLLLMVNLLIAMLNSTCARLKRLIEY